LTDLGLLVNLNTVEPALEWIYYDDNVGKVSGYDSPPVCSIVLTPHYMYLIIANVSQLHNKTQHKYPQQTGR